MTGSVALGAGLIAGLAAFALGSARPGRDRCEAVGLARAGRPYLRHRANNQAEPSVRGRRAAAGLAGLGIAVVIGGLSGLVAGAIAAVMSHHVLGRLEPRSVVRRRAQAAADLPICAHLLAGAIEAGASTLDALDVVATAVPGPIGSQLAKAAAELRLGADPLSVWSGFEPASGLAPLGRTVSRTLTSGAPLADALDRLAIDLRDRRRHDIDRRARTVGVRAAAPLGLCFLPAFLLIGVVPVVIGIARQILTGVL